MEDFARWVNGGATVKLAGSAEFMESAAALPSFMSAYGFKLSAGQLLVLAGGDTAATERAAAEGTSGVNAAMAYGTDGAIAALELVLLEDTKDAQMVYKPCPVVASRCWTRMDDPRPARAGVHGAGRADAARTEREDRGGRAWTRIGRVGVAEAKGEGVMGDGARRVQAPLLGLGAVALAALPYLRHARNRLLSGQPVTLADAVGAAGVGHGVALAGAVLLLLAPVVWPRSVRAPLGRAAAGRG